MRTDSSFQPDESCNALTITRGAWRTDFTNTRKAATQHLHFRGAAIILAPDRSQTCRGHNPRLGLPLLWIATAIPAIRHPALGGKPEIPVFLALLMVSGWTDKLDQMNLSRYFSIKRALDLMLKPIP
jgi:hypothetical protein